MHAVFKYKAASLLAESGALGPLGGLLKAVEDRTANFDRLIIIKGKLELLLQLVREERKVKKSEIKYEAVHIIDEDKEEEIEGVEVLSVNEYKNAREMIEEEIEKISQGSEEMPDVVEDIEDEQEDLKINQDKSESEVSDNEGKAI